MLHLDSLHGVPKLAGRVTAITLSCGTYDCAGEFAFDVGFPCKSGL